MLVDVPFRTLLTVEGMTCQHCARSVTEELEGIPGVCTVAVELASGAVTVAADREVPRAELAAAVDEAGFALVG
jgi:copper chaperone